MPVNTPPPAHPSHARRRTLVVGLAPLLAVLGGCAEPPATVAGSVRFAGQPMAGWVVNFEMPSRGVAAMATTDDGGRFGFPAPLEPGEYVVFVSPPTPDPTPGEKPKRPPINPPARAVPERAQQVSTSDLRAAVKPGPNELDLEVKP